MTGIASELRPTSEHDGIETARDNLTRALVGLLAAHWTTDTEILDRARSALKNAITSAYSHGALSCVEAMDMIEKYDLAGA